MGKRGNGIVSIKNLFDVYRAKLRPPQSSVITTVLGVIQDLYDITLTKSELSYNTTTRTLVLRARGPIKSELLLHKEEILTHLKGRLGEKYAPTSII